MGQAPGSGKVPAKRSLWAPGVCEAGIRLLPQGWGRAALKEPAFEKRGQAQGRLEVTGSAASLVEPWATGAGTHLKDGKAPRRRTAPAGGRLSAQPGPGRGHLGPSARPAGPGKELRAGAPVTFLGLGPGRGRAVSGRARSGRPGPCGAPGTAAAAEGHREEGASHVGAPRPPPASERDEVGGAAAAGRAPAGGGDRRGGAAPPLPSETLPPGRIRGGSRGASSRASAHDPGPPLSPEAQILPPATATPSRADGYVRSASERSPFPSSRCRGELGVAALVAIPLSADARGKGFPGAAAPPPPRPPPPRGLRDFLCGVNRAAGRPGSLQGPTVRIGGPQGPQPAGVRRGGDGGGQGHRHSAAALASEGPAGRGGGSHPRTHGAAASPDAGAVGAGRGSVHSSCQLALGKEVQGGRSRPHEHPEEDLGSGDQCPSLQPAREAGAERETSITARKAKPRAPVSVSGLKTQEGVGVEEAPDPSTPPHGERVLERGSCDFQSCLEKGATTRGCGSHAPLSFLAAAWSHHPPLCAKLCHHPHPTPEASSTPHGLPGPASGTFHRTLRQRPGSGPGQRAVGLGRKPAASSSAHPERSACSPGGERRPGAGPASPGHVHHLGGANELMQDGDPSSTAESKPLLSPSPPGPPPARGLSWRRGGR
ncbi:collagen alpha-1(I) chain-like [Balaenoptera musculus]|uniref:Collagen alpha-1(I) chain-like n=1 Tax=Balaenoptera musculus TaxID=9771 RepID=A0A8B8XEQ6_BALMU|nr:collagen alpha-1(I) chain-like [Balaenoptera musculus]